MKPIRSSKTALAAGVLLALSLGGCVVSPGRVVVEPPRVGFISPVVVTEPPAPIVEVQGVAPQPGDRMRGSVPTVAGACARVTGTTIAEPRVARGFGPRAAAS